MRNETIIPFENGDPSDESYESVISETQKLHNMQNAMKARSAQVREDYITELQNGLGLQMKQFATDPEKYSMPVIHKTRWQKFKESISSIFNKITTVI